MARPARASLGCTQTMRREATMRATQATHPSTNAPWVTAIECGAASTKTARQTWVARSRKRATRPAAVDSTCVGADSACPVDATM